MQPEVHIRIIHTASFDCALASQILTPAERSRAARYRFDEDRQRYIAGRATLRRMLAERTGTRAEDLIIEDSEYRKPRLVLDPAPFPPIHFNVSHSGDYALIALSTDAEVGIDIEVMRADCPIEDLSRRYYSSREYGWLRSLPPKDRLEGFYRLWTLKEAVLKCAGFGLSVSTRDVSLDLAANAPLAITCTDPSHAAIERYRVRELRLVAGYASALALAAEIEPEVTVSAVE